MGQVVNSLAFPVPQLPRAFYHQELLTHPGFLRLTTSLGEGIPACHVCCPRRPEQGFLAGPQKQWTLLYSHGNAEDLGLQMDFIKMLAEDTRTNIFCYEYLGYSLSRLEGAEPSEAGCLRSIDAAWRYLTESLRIPPSQIVLFGRSIGTGPSVDLAARRSIDKCAVSPQQVGGVLLQSPLESGARVAFGPATSYVGYYLDIFTNYEKIDKITAPVAIIHGTQDEVVPCDHGRALHKSLQQPYRPRWVQGAGHNDIPHEEVVTYLRNFLAHLDVREPDSSK